MSDISLNFSISDEYMSHSNIVAETYLRNDSIFLEKKHIISRKKIANELINFDNLLEVNLLKSKQNSLDLIIFIKHSKGSIYLKSGDSFATKWFFDNLISNIEKYNKINKEVSDKKVKEFNDFLENINKPLSKKEQNSLKKKNKFYNHCLSEER